VETKLYRSSERRTALAQAIEYASALWSEYPRNPDGFIAKLKEGSSTTIEEEVLKNIKESIMNGGFGLIVAMDRIDENVVKVINFLNEMCEFDVYGLSLEKYRSDNGVEVVIPKLYPGSPPEPVVQRTKGKIWNWDAFLEDVDRRGFSHEALEDIYRFSEEITKGKGGLRWGKGRTYATWQVYIEDTFGGAYIFAVESNGYLRINFARLYPKELSDETSRKTRKIVDNFAEQLYNAGLLEGRITYENHREGGKYLGIKFERWKDKIGKFKEIVRELISSMESLTTVNT